MLKRSSKYRDGIALFLTPEIENEKNKMYHKIRLLKTDTELKYHKDISKNNVYMKH